jgi:hypothetical protein
MGGEKDLNREDAFWLEELRQCREDWRYLNSFIWQAPSVSIVIVGALMGIAFYAVENTLARGLLLTASALFTLVLTFAMHRHHGIQLSRQQQYETIVGYFLGAKMVRTNFRMGSYSAMLAAMVTLTTLLVVLSASVFAGLLR